MENFNKAMADLKAILATTTDKSNAASMERLRKVFAAEEVLRIAVKEIFAGFDSGKYTEENFGADNIAAVEAAVERYNINLN